MMRYKKLFAIGLAFSLLFVFFATTFAFDKAKFAVITDTHMALYGEDGMKMGSASVKIVENTVKALNEMEGLDFVVVTGDLLLDGEPWNLDLIKANLDELLVPYYVIAGNHDYAPASQAKPDKPPYVAVSKGAVVWTFQGHGYKGANAWWGADPVPGLHLIGLDSNVPTHWGGHLPLAEIRWLDRQLYAYQDMINVVFCHHNFVPWHDEDEVGQKWDKFQVQRS